MQQDLDITELLDQVVTLVENNGYGSLSFARQQKLKETVLEVVKKAVVCRDALLREKFADMPQAQARIDSNRARVKVVYGDDNITIRGAKLC